MNIKSELVLEI